LGVAVLIGLLGDVHGQVFHALVLLLTWQARTGRRFNFIAQVGDMGAEPAADQAERPPFDPFGADFAHLLKATGSRAVRLHRVRKALGCPIHFLRGNHEDTAWLQSLLVDRVTGTAQVDPFDLLRYVPDGAVLRVGPGEDGGNLDIERSRLRVAFLGGVEEQTDAAGINSEAYASLLALPTGSIDVLLTHEGHYGTSIGFRGDVHGSRMMTRLLETAAPTFFAFGHAHQRIGPARFGRTAYVGLDGLLPFRKWQPDATGFLPGCLALIETREGSLTPVTDPWLPNFPTHPFDFDAWVDEALDT
jgi:hypothetical protein